MHTYSRLLISIFFCILKRPKMANKSYLPWRPALCCTPDLSQPGKQGPRYHLSSTGPEERSLQTQLISSRAEKPTHVCLMTNPVLFSLCYGYLFHHNKQETANLKDRIIYDFRTKQTWTLPEWIPSQNALGEPRASYTVTLKLGPFPPRVLCVCGEGRRAGELYYSRMNPDGRNLHHLLRYIRGPQRPP